MVYSVFYLDQTVDPRELVSRFRKLADVLKEMDQEQFRQITVWMRNVIKCKLPGSLQKEIERVLDKTEPREVEKMINNIERTLDEMQWAAEARGMEKGQTKGKLEGKIEVAKIALKKGFSVNDVAENNWTINGDRTRT